VASTNHVGHDVAQWEMAVSCVLLSLPTSGALGTSTWSGHIRIWSVVRRPPQKLPNPPQNFKLKWQVRAVRLQCRCMSLHHRA
jgi:hypothetical protein